MGQWQSQPVCTTPACIHAASSILKNLNPDWAKIDACTNFDQSKSSIALKVVRESDPGSVVCYGAPEHFGEDNGPMGDMAKRTANILRKILESPNHATAAGVKSTFLTARSNSEEQNFDMLRTVYQSCMDVDAMTALGTKPLTELIVSINKTWPVSPTDLRTKVGQADFAGLQKASLFIEELGIPAFHSYCLESNPIMPDFLDSVRRAWHPLFDSLVVASNTGTENQPRLLWVSKGAPARRQSDGVLGPGRYGGVSKTRDQRLPPRVP